ncbi:hypothetical protein HMPREF0290_2732 [Corynebacterium efficiens YS-314]|nr:hypothetical protein HMPREF0290_2732 [Corynebacterium efficiens YS-314]
MIFRKVIHSCGQHCGNNGEGRFLGVEETVETLHPTQWTTFELLSFTRHPTNT